MLLRNSPSGEASDVTKIPRQGLIYRRLIRRANCKTIELKESGMIKSRPKDALECGAAPEVRTELPP
jgi:hypothetical protein